MRFALMWRSHSDGVRVSAAWELPVKPHVQITVWTLCVYLAIR